MIVAGFDGVAPKNTEIKRSMSKSKPHSPSPTYCRSPEAETAWIEPSCQSWTQGQRVTCGSPLRQDKLISSEEMTNEMKAMETTQMTRWAQSLARLVAERGLLNDVKGPGNHI